MEIVEYFTPGFSSYEEVEGEFGPIYDATTLQKVADCPRKFEVRVVENIERPSNSPKMVAGIATHAGLEYYYAHADRNEEIEETSIQIVRDEWNSFNIDRGKMDPNAVHLSEGHLADVMANYFKCWNYERIEIFEPIVVRNLDELNLSQVLAGKFVVADSGEIILGESKLVMQFDLDGSPLILAGKPDLPVVRQDGSLYVMDHKTTSSYLSDWWAKSYETSNQLRGYMAFVQALFDRTPAGAVINGIYVGKHATNPNSKAAKFERYPFDFTPDHITEALYNQRGWQQVIDFYAREGYYPQACAYGGCAMPDLCRRDPIDREEVKRTDYVTSTRRFWDL